MKQFKETIYFNRDKEENWDIEEKAEDIGFSSEVVKELKWLGAEVRMEVLIQENGDIIVLSIQGEDVSDREIYI